MIKKYDDLGEDDFKQESIHVDGKTIEFKSTTMEKIEQDLLKLNDKDKAFITYSLGDADGLLKLIDRSIDNYSATDLDTLIDLWLNKQETFKLVTEDEFATAIGSAFGNCINNIFGSTWIVVDDEYGTDYACALESPNFQTFPFSSVWKTIEQKREGSLESIILVVKNHLNTPE